MFKPTKPQLTTLKRLWLRERAMGCHESYRLFRKRAFLAFGDCLMVPLPHIVIGIESDGYAHS